MSIFPLIHVLLATGLVILLPGFLLTYALFPQEVEFDGVQRFAMSGGLGVILSILIGTFLIVVQIGLSLDTFLPAIGLISLFAAASIWRNGRLRIWPGFRSQPVKPFSGIAFLLVLVLITAVFPSKRPLNDTEQYTEFYLHKQDTEFLGTTTNRTTTVITPGIINHEQTGVAYHIRIEQAGQLLHESEMIQLEPEAKWEGELVVPISDTVSSVTAPLDIFLFRAAESAPYRQLTIWLDSNR